MFNPLIFVSAGRSKTNPSTPRLYQMRFSLLIIAFLATLSSAATVPERASTRIPTLLVDTSPPPSPQSSEELLDIFPSYINRPGLRDVEEVDSGDSNHATPRENGEMRRRNAKAVHTTTTTTPSKPTNSALASSSPLPEPFDNTPASAFQSSGSTDACPKFISNLLSNPTFKSCYPLSMMLQVSFFFIFYLGDAEYAKQGLNLANSDMVVLDRFLPSRKVASQHSAGVGCNLQSRLVVLCNIPRSSRDEPHHGR